MPRALTLSVFFLLLTVGLLTRPLSADEPPESQLDASESPTSETPPAVTGPQPGSLAAPLLAKRAAEQELSQKLLQQVTVKFDQQPIDSVVAQLRELTGIPIQIDVTQFEDAGIPTDEPVSGHYVDLPLETVLSRCLEDLDCTWLIEDEAVHITTIDVAYDQLETRVTDVSALLKWMAGQEKPSGRDRFGRSDTPAPSQLGIVTSQSPAQASLADILMTSTSALWEDIDGAGGTASFNRGLMTVRQTRIVHHEIDVLLNTLQRAVAHQTPGATWYIESDGFGAPGNRQVVEHLARKTTFKCTEAPLHYALSHLAETEGIAINLDTASLDSIGVLTDEPVTLAETTASLSSILSLLLDDLELVHIPRDNGLLVTTRDRPLESASVTAIHDIRDLTAAKQFESARLIDTIMQETSGYWVDIDGEGGEVTELHGLLLVRQMPGTQAEIEVLLRDIRSRPAPEAVMPESADQPEETRFYKVSTPEEVESVQEALITFVFPDTWETNGGNGEMLGVGRSLIVRQTPEVHAAIAAFLKELSDDASE